VRNEKEQAVGVTLEGVDQVNNTLPWVKNPEFGQIGHDTPTVPFRDGDRVLVAIPIDMSQKYFEYNLIVFDGGKFLTTRDEPWHEWYWSDVEKYIRLNMSGD